MVSYLIYRHGSNAANQSMTQTMAVGIVTAETEEAARRIANDNINCYANQRLSLVAEDDLDDDDKQEWNEVSLRDANLRDVGEDSIVFG